MLLKFTSDVKGFSNRGEWLHYYSSKVKYETSQCSDAVLLEIPKKVKQFRLEASHPTEKTIPVN